MADFEHHPSMSANEDRDIDGRLADALDRYADGGPPPGLAAMSARAGQTDRMFTSASLVAAAALVFAAGWVADDFAAWRADPVPHEVADLMDVERDWDADFQIANLETLAQGSLTPVSLTDLGLVLIRTEARRARSGSVQRMEYVTQGGRPVSVVMRRERPRDMTEPAVAAYHGRDVVYWTHGPYSFGVTGEATREELIDIAETVRTRLSLEGAAPVRPVADIGPSITGPVSAPDNAAPVQTGSAAGPPGR
ncbi:MAG: hypothetical protein ACLFQ5_00530 [Oceanicaulis sp.]